MSSIDDEFKHESLQDSESIVGYLYALAEGFSSGKIIFGSKAKTLIFHPHGLLKMEVKAKKRSDRVRLSIKFSWKDGIENRNRDQESLIIDTAKS